MERGCQISWGAKYTVTPGHLPRRLNCQERVRSSCDKGAQYPVYAYAGIYTLQLRWQREAHTQAV